MLTDNQILNLVNFTLLFRKECQDSSFIGSHISYIVEKYNKMIGFEPTESIKRLDSDAQGLKSEWMNKWNVSGFKGKDESIVNYLSDVNVSGGLNLPKIVKTFEYHIGSVEGITDEKYNHLHTHFQGFINKFLSSRREQEGKRGFELTPDVKN